MARPEMTGWGVHQDGAVLGRRIRQARRELGLTQAELAGRIGVSLAVLDRFETGKSDPSGSLERIAEITGRPVSWYTTEDDYDVGGEAYENGLPAELRRRLAESNGRHPPTDAEPVEARDGVDLPERGAPLPTEDFPAYEEDTPEAALDGSSPQPAPEPEAATPAEPAAPSETLPDEREELVRRQEELRAALVEQQQEHATRAAQMAEELERANAHRQALAAMLEQSRSELATSRAQEARLTERQAQLESDLRLAEERAADATARLGRAESELELLRTEDRSRAEELGVRSSELDAREAAVVDADKDLEFRSTQLDAREADLRFRIAQLDTRHAELAYWSAQLDTREAELGVRAAQLDTREAGAADVESGGGDRPPSLADVELRAAALEGREEAVRHREDDLDQRQAVLDGPARQVNEASRTEGAMESKPPVRDDVHLAVAPDHGYRLVAREGPPPTPGAVVELDDVRYRCLRVQASPFLGDDRPCAVLELLPPEPQPSHSIG